MKIFKPTFSLLLCAFLLSACGSSSGGGDSSSGAGADSANSSSTDFGLIVNEIEEIASAVEIETADGSIIDLELSPKGILAVETANGVLAGMNNDNSFYGVWVNNDLSQYEVRYQGTEATNIPTSGTATYKGNAFWMSGSDKNLRQGGLAVLNVDFDNKAVDGGISFANSSESASRGDITLHQGTLSGAGFGGQASIAGGLSGEYSGALYGDGATEAAGWVGFAEASHLNVAFGGTKQ